MVSLSLKRYVALCLTVFSFRDRLLIANNDQNDVIQTDMVVMELLSFWLSTEATEGLSVILVNA